MASPFSSSEDKKSKTSVDIEDLRVEIFKRLAVKSICRFRCVCKSWNSLLLSSLFIALHHKFTIANTPAHQKSYLCMDQSYRKNLRCDLYCPKITDLKCLELPLSISMDQYNTVVGVINGVVCLTSSKFSIVIWNPSIRKHISHRYYCNKDSHHHPGFGFNEPENDFKVVVVSRKGPWYDVLSVQDGSWKRKSLPGSICQSCYSTKMLLSLSPSYFINKTIYWAANRKDTSMLLLFDCEREEFKTMELPQELLEEQYNLRFFKHYDMLAVERKKKPRPMWRTRWEIEVWKMEVWAMEEESGNCGNCSKWKKLFIIHDSWSGLTGEGDAIFVVDLDHLPIGPDNFHQPLYSQVLDQSLFIMDAKNKSLTGSSNEYAPMNLHHVESHPSLMNFAMRTNPSNKVIWEMQMQQLPDK